MNYIWSSEDKKKKSQYQRCFEGFIDLIYKNKQDINQYNIFSSMAKVGQADLLKRFKKTDFKSIQLLTSLDQIKGLFSQVSLQPENNKPAQYDPNDIFITHNQQLKKKKTNNTNIKVGKQDNHHHGQAYGHEQHEQRQKVYKPGPFALFCQINEGKLNKDEQVWYYKDNKQIIGPVSSYNMDKMVYYKTIQQDTKVAYKEVEKFVKFKKIKSIVEDQKEKNKQLGN